MTLMLVNIHPTTNNSNFGIDTHIYMKKMYDIANSSVSKYSTKITPNFNVDKYHMKNA